jgi:hypothetical protein
MLYVFPMIKGTGLSLLAFLSKNGSATGTFYE